MATRKVKDKKGKERIIESVALPGGKYGTIIDGVTVLGPAKQFTDPATGITTTTPGKAAESDTEKEALDVGEDNIKMGM